MRTTNKNYVMRTMIDAAIAPKDNKRWAIRNGLQPISLGAIP